MAIKIGHAVYDENGKASGGTAGDQTGKEVCTRKWYNKPWTAVFRATDSVAAEKIAVAMEQACANSKIGYNQKKRTTLYTQAKAKAWDLSKITTACDCDCSALVAVCVNAAGIPVAGTMYTGNEKSLLTKTGKFDVLTDAQHLITDGYLMRGDILLGNGHTAVVLENGEHIKDGGEFEMVMEVLKSGSKGDSVKALQILLIGNGYSCGSYGADGSFGSGTLAAVKKYQKAKGLTADGIAGEKTWKKLLGV